MDNYKTNNNTESIQLPEGFDWVFCVNNYPDLQKAGINTKEKAIQHYLEFGKKEGRQIYPTQQTLPKYYLSICAIIKDEGPYLQEWIEFHKLVGVEHFYIYDNNSTDNTKQILQPYINDKTITYTFWPMHPGQIEAYNDCLKNYGKESKWIAFIDLDEFLYSPKEDDLKKVIIDYEQYPAIGVNWVCFGSNNIEKKTDELVIKRFTKRAFLNFPPNRHIKSIVQSILTECAGNTPHQFIYKNNSLAVDENFNFIQKNESLSKNISINKIRINHYLVKSKEECENKLSRGRATIKDNRKEDYFKEHNKNDEEDLIITRFLPELKDALNKKKYL
ncbi:MAG: Glycosyl transferase family 2 [archaeon ADurb.Bin336]|nr:MAG: Glycosyl transferase family 2 [archaeon ADurb.Bin336]